MPSISYGSIANTPHDYPNTAYGRCGICHAPHATQGTSRLWRVAPTLTGAGNDWGSSNIGQLCASCHNGGALVGVNNKYGNSPHQAGGTVYATTSHGRSMAVLASIGGATGPIEGKLYTAAGANIECTSCHNVHYDGVWVVGGPNPKRPFLRTSATNMSAFCAECHPDRVNDAGSGGGSGALNITGNHPINIAYNGNLSTNGSEPIYLEATPDGRLTNPVALTSWTLGGKFQKPDGSPAASGDYGAISSLQMGCQSCHSVHSPDNAGSGDQSLHLLSINNSSGAIAALCEGCHGNATGNPPRSNSGATMMVGTIAGDHPIDIPVSPPGPVIDKWYINNLTVRSERTANTDKTWPNPLNGSGQHVIICTSCHSAHRARTAASPSDIAHNGFSFAFGTIVDNTAGGKLTRLGGNSTWCRSCHGDPAPAGHHSNTANWPSSLVSCTDCHSSSVSIASNNASQLCNTCHMASGRTDPVYAAVPNGHLTGTASASHTSHYVGPFANVPGYVNVKRGDWANHALGEYSAFSKYGNDGVANTYSRSPDPVGNQLVCESCHSILRNLGARKASATSSSGYMNNLLLQDFQDDSKEQASPGTDAGAKAAGSGLCVACHNNVSDNSGGMGNGNGPVADSTVLDTNIVVVGTHPMTNWSVTRARDAGRAKHYLVTTTADETYADAAGAPNAGSYPAQDQMDCDSCHRPHMAPDNGTYDQTKTGQANKSLTGDNAMRPVILEYQQNANEWGDMCQQCHNM